MLSRTTTLLGLSAAVLLLSPADAWAYIDPGTGSYLFQLIIAGGLAGLYTLRRYWYTVRSWFVRRKDDR